MRPVGSERNGRGLSRCTGLARIPPEYSSLSEERARNLPGTQEVDQEIAELHRQLAARLSPEDRLYGLSVEERLKGLPVEERLRGLSPEERAKLLELLLRTP